MRIFHATFIHRLLSISKLGLGAIRISNTENSHPDHTYFAENQAEAEKIARHIAHARGFEKNEIVVLGVMLEDLDPAKITRTMRDNGEVHYLYHKSTIHPSLITIEIRSDQRGKPMDIYRRRSLQEGWWQVPRD